MNYLPAHRRALILRCLLDGMSMRATGRTAEAAKQTVVDLFNEASLFAYKTQDRLLRNIVTKRA